MNNLFHRITADSIMQRIHQLSADSSPKWGKMNAAQMLCHCNMVLCESLEPAPAKRVWLGYLLGNGAKKKFLSSSVFKPGGYTSPRLVVESEQDFPSSKDSLVVSINEFCRRGPESYEGRLHAFFGVMTADEWGRIQFNHLNHHLTQFNV